ncbi:MAG TPA: delta(1)-pyrroline-2-carboxylate reductase family protein, partial [Ottowia sp.]|nr:delta(1)-pyrroline-2-carboxylate reductase family protein [Ottowia sp.]
DAEHEAGDLIQAGVPVAGMPTLAQVVAADEKPAHGPVLFKNCGWAGWDLAAARLAMRTS